MDFIVISKIWMIFYMFSVNAVPRLNIRLQIGVEIVLFSSSILRLLV